MSNETDNLINTIKKPFKVAEEWLNKIPDQKQKYTDMHAKRVNAANKSFRDAADKNPAPAKKKVGGAAKQDTIKTIKKSAPKKKYAAKR